MTTSTTAPWFAPYVRTLNPEPRKKSKRVLVAALVGGAVLGLSTLANAAGLIAAPVHMPEGGLARCTVVQNAETTYHVTAELVGQGRNLTEYLSTEWFDEAGTMLKVLVAESTDERVRGCKVQVRGTQRKSSVIAVLEVFDASGQRVEVIEAR